MEKLTYSQFMSCANRAFHHKRGACLLRLMRDENGIESCEVVPVEITDISMGGA